MYPLRTRHLTPTAALAFLHGGHGPLPAVSRDQASLIRGTATAGVRNARAERERQMKRTLAVILLLAACGGPATSDVASTTTDLAASCCGQPGCTLPCPAPVPDAGTPPCCPAGDVLMGNACCPACAVPAPGQVACAMPCMLAASVCPAPPTCTPTCARKACGANDGCGGRCGIPARVCQVHLGRLRCVEKCNAVVAVGP